MKKSQVARIKLFSLLAVLSFSLFSCSGNGPEGVAEKFVVLTSQGDFTEAKKYCDESTAAMMNMAETLVAGKKEELKEKNKDIKVDIISSDVKDDKATVKYNIVNGETTSEEKQIDLKKIDGEWKVSLNKEGAGATP